MGWGIEAVVAIAEEIAARPSAVFLVPSFPRAALMLMVAGGLWLCLWRRLWRLAGLALMALGMALAAQAERPDVLVSGDARLVGLVTADGTRALSTLRRARFEGEQWLRRDAVAAPAPWPAAGAGRISGLACDALGCFYAGPDGTVAVLFDGRALDEDCAAVDLVVSLLPVPRGACPGPVVIDQFDLWRGGAHAAWLEEGAVRTESVRSRQGDRPWAVQR